MKLNYPELLPITAHREEIVQAIMENQVVVVVGETGSGKSTQIPKMILEALSRAEQSDPEFSKYKVACTQPRRIAAVSIATWMAQETEVNLGEEVGYKIRFDDDTQVGTLITICTDGILLQEMKSDGLLSKYDAILVDEAHERNLNIDFLLGLLKDIQFRRQENGLKLMKILVTSATVDSEKFVSFFADLNGDKRIPVVNVSGRMYPVEIKYSPVKEEENVYQKIALIIRDIAAKREQGDVLIFMPGEAEIFRTIREIELLNLSKVKCLPLYSMLTMDDQQLIYHDFPGKLKVVVATNIAETSLTVPGVKYVIDSGVARLTDFNFRTGIGSLEVREISQSSAVQRAGRAGRVQAGECIRLFDEENFLDREKYTKPEIQRSDLSSVVLHMILIGIKDVQNFNFIDAPEPRAFRNALENLHELGALDEQNNLTELGLKMAHLPLEPRISAMLLAAEKYGCVRAVAVIASSLSVKDPFVRPNGEEEEADRAKRYFQKLATGKGGDYRIVKLRKGSKIIRKKVFDKSSQNVLASDLVVFLIVWNKLQSIFTEEQRQKYCRDNYLNFKVFQEIEQICHQLLDTLKTFAAEEFGQYTWDKEAFNWIVDLDDQVSILKSISTGFIQNLCEAESHQAYKSRNAENIFIHPGSILFNISPKWFVASEIVETSRLYARNNTMVDPVWFEEIAPQLCQTKKGNIFFDAREGRVVREEEVFFRGHRIVKARMVDVANRDKDLAEDYFVREALVKRSLGRQFPFILENEKVVEQLKVYAAKVAKKEWAVDAVKLQKWYVNKARASGYYLTSTKILQEILDRKGDNYLKIKIDDFVSSEEREKLDKLFPATVFLNGVKHEVMYSYNDYRFPSGPVISLKVQELVDLNQAKFIQFLKDKNADFKPHLMVSNGDAFSAIIAQGDDVDELKKEVDRWHLKKFWKKARHDKEVKGIRFDEIFHYLEDVLEKVLIGNSLFFGVGDGSAVYAYVGMRIEGKKISLVLFEEEEVAVKSTRQAIRSLFASQVKQNLYFKESDILALEELYHQKFEGIEWKDLLVEVLWKKLDLESALPEKNDLKQVSKVKQVLEEKKNSLEKMKEEIVNKAKQIVEKMLKLSESESEVDEEKVQGLKRELESGEW